MTKPIEFEDYANEIMQEVFEAVDQEADLIFGNSECPTEDEAEFVLSSSFMALSLPEKLQALSAFRSKKGIQSN